MITTFELKSIAFNIVKNSTIKSIINGEVCIDQRPFNSTKNDVVIGSLSVATDPLHSSVVLVNIYAQDIQSGTSYFPNLALLNNATKLLMPLFDKVYLEDKKTYLEIEYQRDYKVDGKNEWVSVIRLQTRTIN
ncbi:hypothetical protein EG339_02630 [Chryseobacterium bernardetii]|uniref:DUF3168 domain-containing protein n=1 Tax=Chryseobacterium bernardetii TaxID=1241978 RepID=A0A3G6T2K4_9FLAO|nr:hypothetical protein [Chryseobacterium bernardetii]AZB23592.1 hypothetical protein EG339_02630 [Chryseobacterium bernardetii]